MRLALTIVLLVLTRVAAGAQSPDTSSPMVRNDDWRVTLTLFRSPGTGVQVSKGHLAAFVGHYPTVIKRDGRQRTTHFVRMGMAWYAAPDASTSPYVSLSLAPSLTTGWSTSAIGDVGLRQNFGRRFNGQLGAAVLYEPHTRATRLNPTVGMGVRF